MKAMISDAVLAIPPAVAALALAHLLGAATPARPAARLRPLRPRPPGLAPPPAGPALGGAPADPRTRPLGQRRLAGSFYGRHLGSLEPAGPAPAVWRNARLRVPVHPPPPRAPIPGAEAQPRSALLLDRLAAGGGQLAAFGPSPLPSPPQPYPLTIAWLLGYLVKAEQKKAFVCPERTPTANAALGPLNPKDLVPRSFE